MKHDEDKLFDGIRRKMDGYEVPVGDELWNKIAADVTPKRRRVFAPIWRAAAAVALLCVVATLLYIGGYDGSQSGTRLPDEMAVVAGTSVAGSQSDETASTQHSVAEIVEEQHDSRPAARTEVAEVVDLVESVEAVEPEEAVADGQEPQQPVDTATEAELPNLREVQPSEPSPRVPASRLRRPRQQQASRWQLSMAVTNQFANGSSSSGGFAPLMHSSFGTIMNSNSRGDDMPEFERSYYTALSSNTSRLTTTDDICNIPITYEISARYKFGRRFGIDFGIRYTTTSSERRSGSDNDFYTSTLRTHYVGVPVSLSYSLFDSRYFTVYALAGGSIEKCVSAKRKDVVTATLMPQDSQRSYSLDSHPWQGELNVGAGLQFNVTPRYGIFAEPKLYYSIFDSKGLPLKPRNDLGLQLSVGLRLSY